VFSLRLEIHRPIIEQDDSPRVVRLSLLGPPGSGKTTQAQLLEQALHVVHVTLEQVLSEPDLCEPYHAPAESLHEDQLCRKLVQRLRQPDCEQRGFVLDGIPRSQKEVLALSQEGILPSLFISLTVRA
jgi:adenylate kinase